MRLMAVKAATAMSTVRDKRKLLGVGLRYDTGSSS